MKLFKKFLILLLMILLNLSQSIAQPQYQPLDAKGQPIKRFDFSLYGSSCVICYFKINDMLNKTKGIYKCAVMLEKPHAGVCVYNPNIITKEIIISKILNAKLKISVKPISDRSITKIPSVLIPEAALAK